MFKNNRTRFKQMEKLMEILYSKCGGTFGYFTEPQQAVYGKLHKILLFGIYGSDGYFHGRTFKRA